MNGQSSRYGTGWRQPIVSAVRRRRLCQRVALWLVLGGLAVIAVGLCLLLVEVSGV